MNLRISGKHMDVGDSLRTRIEERVAEAIDKYFDGGFSGRVTMTKSASRFSADCMLHLDSGVSLQATASAVEPVLAFDIAAERLDKRLRRYKRRLKAHVGGVGGGRATNASYAIMSIPGEDEDIEIDEDFAPAIVAESTIALRAMSVASAVVELDTKESPVFVFRNAGNDQINIVYRRPDGHIGWIDPSTATKAAER